VKNQFYKKYGKYCFQKITGKCNNAGFPSKHPQRICRACISASLLTDINKKLGVTIIIITHELSVVQAICSHVAVISEGRLAESGAVADVFGSPRSAVTKLLLGREE